MFPIPCLFLTIEGGGSIPLPPGSVKKIAFTREQDSVVKRSMAILLSDGRLYVQGDNAWGECADGTTSPFYNLWKLSATGVADVFGVGKTFIIKYNSGDWKYAGSTVQLTASGSNVTSWTSLPSTITTTIPLENVVNITGSGGNTLFLMSDRTLYGSGTNASGCLGAGNSDPVPTPRIISYTCVRAFGINACVSYNSTGGGILRVCGLNYGIIGNGTSQTTTFHDVDFSALSDPMYVKEWMTNEKNSIAIASSKVNDFNHYLYARAILPGGTTATYQKVPNFGPFTTYKVLEGGQSRFFIADNVLYAVGASQRVLGLGSGSTEVTMPTVVPVPTGDDWDLSKLTYIADIKADSMVEGSALSHWMVYDGNLFYTGNPKGFFGKTTTIGNFTNIPETSFEGVTATSLTTGSIGTAIAGTTKQLTWTLEPPGAEIYDLQFTSSHPEFATVDANGLMTFVAEGGFDITMTAKTGTSATTLTDTSGGYVSTLGMATDSLSALTVGDTAQLVYTVTPSGVEDLEGYSITFSSEDPSVATVSSTGLITAVADGGTRIHATASVQSVTADDSSYLTVNAP